MRKLVEFLSNLIRRSWKTALLIAIVAVVTIAVSASVSMWLSRYHNMRFPSIGTIYTIGVEAYWDQNLTNKITQIQWGIVYPDTRNNVTTYLHILSNIPTTLILKTENWTFINTSGINVTEPPDLETHMNLTWNYANHTVSPDQIIETTLTLTVTNNFTFLEYLIKNNVTTFHFDIIIRTQQNP